MIAFRRHTGPDLDKAWHSAGVEIMSRMAEKSLLDIDVHRQCHKNADEKLIFLSLTFCVLLVCRRALFTVNDSC